MFWHGREESIEDKVADVCTQDPGNDEYYWDDTLELFAEHFDKFMVLGNVIAVTQYKSFSQR